MGQNNQYVNINLPSTYIMDGDNNIIERRCSQCKKYKKLSFFVKNNKSAVGVGGICKECKNINSKKIKNTEEYRDYCRKNYKKTKHIGKERRNVNTLVSRFRRAQGVDITVKDYNDLYSGSQKVCEICGKTEEENKERLNLDHCHNTKKIRGFLCGTCNRGLGMFKDDIKLIESAITYLQERNG